MLFNKTFHKPKLHLRPLICAAALLPVFFLVNYAAYWLRFEGQLAATQQQHFISTIGWVLLVKAVVFGWFGVYRGWSRYVTFHDLVVLVQASTVSSLLLAVGDYLLLPAVSIPRSVFLMDWGATIVVLGGVRSLSRLWEETERFPLLSHRKTPVLIVGANNSGEALLRAIRRNPKLSYKVVGFISDDASALGSCIGGVPVIGTLDQTCNLARARQIPEVLITAGELSGQQVRQLVDAGRQCNVSVKVLPSYEQLLRGSVDLRPRTVSIEDLLGREPVQLNLQELQEWLNDRVLLVTGSAGSIGSEISRQLLQFSPQRLVLVDRSENGQFFLERELKSAAPKQQMDVCIADVGDRDRMSHLLNAYRPDIIFHAAAYKHVPLMESNPCEAVKNITQATQILADLSEEHGVRSFVMISTDKAVNPSSIMGSCKRLAELYVQAMSERSRCRFVTVRFGNVLDSAGSVVPLFREQIAHGGPITVTDPEMTRYFMTIPEASQLVIQAGAMGKGGEIFVLDMGHPVKIVDLAGDMIRLSGLHLGQDIDIEFIGTRPGEKLFEELYMESEDHVNTAHPKIMVAECQKPELLKVRRCIDQLTASPENLRGRIRTALQELTKSLEKEESANHIDHRRAA